MPLPRSVTRVTRNGIEFTSNVDRVNYTLNELCRAALRDVAKFLRKRMVAKFKKLPGMGRSKRIFNSTQYWVRKKEADLQIGLKHDSWYGAMQELGTKNQPKRSILRDTVYENVDQIRLIQSQYIKAIEDELRARELISDDEYTPEEGDES